VTGGRRRVKGTKIPPLAQGVGSGDDDPVPVLAVLAVIVIWRYAIKGKGNPAARLAALLCAIIVALIAVSMVNLHAAGMAASGFASGIKQAAVGIGQFIAQF
jgi:hypothetical protein